MTSSDACTHTDETRSTLVAHINTAGTPPSAGPDDGSTTVEEFVTIESTRSGKAWR
jgi:hypothetical protein